MVNIDPATAINKHILRPFMSDNNPRGARTNIAKQVKKKKKNLVKINLFPFLEKN